MAKPGGGINSSHTDKFIKLNRDIQLTHFIFQIPSPSRQTVYLDLDNKAFFDAPIDYYTHARGKKLRGWIKNMRRHDNEHGLNKLSSRSCTVQKRGKSNVLTDKQIEACSVKKGNLTTAYLIDRDAIRDNEHTPCLLYDNFLWTRIKHHCCLPTSVWTVLRAHSEYTVDPLIIDLFEVRDRYFKKAIQEVNKVVCLVRKQWPNIKIIFLRYEETGMPLVYEYNKLFFKKNVLDYCNKNNITYIYEKNFNTEWFRLNNLTNDSRHPNAKGAKLITEKIKQFL